jgi:hypothetical protein
MEKASLQVAIQGKEADQVMEMSASVFGWLLYEAGVANISPEKFGIPKP